MENGDALSGLTAAQPSMLLYTGTYTSYCTWGVGLQFILNVSCSLKRIDKNWGAKEMVITKIWLKFTNSREVYMTDNEVQFDKEF